MPRTIIQLLADVSHDLTQELNENGPIPCFDNLPIYVSILPILDPTKGNTILFPQNIETINQYTRVGITAQIDDDALLETIHHHIQLVAIALQLVKPTPDFLEYWIDYDSETGCRSASTNVRGIAKNTDEYLIYQQHHVITHDVLHRAINLLPTLSLVKEQHPDGSWSHPYTSVHRAVIFFCQGYTVGIHPLPQVFWAAGLDSLFASKRDRNRQGAREISRRMQQFFGTTFDPYTADTVQVPEHQTRPQLALSDIGEHIFWLRNAYIHGSPIPDPSWLAPNGVGYAYYLVECTEILLRVSLIRILEDVTLLNTFRDAASLDAYF